MFVVFMLVGMYVLFYVWNVVFYERNVWVFLVIVDDNECKKKGKCGNLRRGCWILIFVFGFI